MSGSPFLSELKPVCPDHLLELAREKKPARTAIVRAGGTLPMKAAKSAVDAGVISPVFIGEADPIKKQADGLEWDISAFELIETQGEKEAASRSAELARVDAVDVIMKGDLHTDTFMGALVRKESGIRTSSRLVHAFYITDPVQQKPLIVSDAALNVSPDLKTRQTAIQLVDDMARKCGIERPKIAILSATESAIPSVPSSMMAKTLSDWAQENVTTSDVVGPLALDLILSEASAQTKGYSDDPVAGKADAVIVPDLVSGNALFKALVYLAGGCAAGVVLGGKLPIVLTSRSDPPEARLASLALATIMRSDA